MVVGIINAATVSIARKPGLAKCSIRFIFVALLGVKLRVPLKTGAEESTPLSELKEWILWDEVAKNDGQFAGCAPAPGGTLAPLSARSYLCSSPRIFPALSPTTK